MKGVTSLILWHPGGCNVCGVQQRISGAPGENETETYVHLLTHNQFEVCTMVIHDRSIDKCGKLVEGDVSLNENVDGSANKDWYS